MDVAHCITYITQCFLQCKIIFKGILKRLHSLGDVVANAFIFNHTTFVLQTVTKGHPLFSLLFSLLF